MVGISLQVLQIKDFGVIGVFTSSLTGGKNYGGKTDYTTVGALDPGIDDIIGGLNYSKTKKKLKLTLYLMGAAHHTKEKAQAIAEKCNTSC